MKQLEAKDKEFIKQVFSSQINKALYFLNRYMTIDEAKAYIAEKLPGYKYNSQKSYIDIENIREEAVELNGNITRKTNIGCFKPGDRIFISEKLDGSNASIAWNYDKNDLDCFSRTRQLEEYGGLNGYVEWVHTKMDKRVKDFLRNCPQYVIFGEWTFRNKSNKISYNDSVVQTWNVFSIWNRSSDRWCRPEFVKKVCEDYGLTFIHELYWGPFISWEHCKSFLHKNTYGDTQEGIVVVNCDKIEFENREPATIKIVNKEFSELNKNKIKNNQNKEVYDQQKNKAMELLSSVVTKNRIEKIIFKSQENELLPKELTEKDLKLIAKVIPRAVFIDINKEEPEIVKSAGEQASKASNQLTMNIVRNLILADKGLFNE